MSNAIFKVPTAINEPVKGYAPGSPEREELLAKYKEMYNQDPIDVPMYIGGKEVRTEDKRKITSLKFKNLDKKRFSDDKRALFLI